MEPVLAWNNRLSFLSSLLILEALAFLSFPASLFTSMYFLPKTFLSASLRVCFSQFVWPSKNNIKTGSGFLVLASLSQLATIRRWKTLKRLNSKEERSLCTCSCCGAPTLKRLDMIGVCHKQDFSRIIYFSLPDLSKDGLGETKTIFSLPEDIPYEYASFLSSLSKNVFSCLDVSCFWSPNL